MQGHVLMSVLAIAALGFTGVGSGAHRLPEGAGQTYQVVKVCSLLTLAEVKALAPWEPLMDKWATAEEAPIGTTGSSCNYVTVFIQVMQFQQSFMDAARKGQFPLQPITGVGDDAWVRNNRGLFAELLARVGPHILTVQQSIGVGKSFESAKPALIEIGKAYAAKLR